MKTQRILGILWLTLFSLIVLLWLWKLSKGDDMSSDLGFQAIAAPVYLFGAIASVFLIRGARWAHIAIGIIAFSIASIVIWLIGKSGWRWPDGCLGVFALASGAMLLFPRPQVVHR